MPDPRNRAPRSRAVGNKPATRRVTPNRKPPSAGRTAQARGAALARPRAAAGPAKRVSAHRPAAGHGGGRSGLPSGSRRAERKKRERVLRERRGTFGSTVLSGVLIAILGFCVILVGVEYKNYLAFREMRSVVESDAFYPGVEVDGVDLSGMTLSHALSSFTGRERDRASATGVTFTYGDKRWTLTPEDLGYRTDYTDVLKRAYRLGREGSLRERYNAVLSLKSQGAPLSVTRGYDQGALRNAVNSIATQLERDARDAEVGDFDFDSRSFRFISAAAGMNVDAEALYARAEQVIASGRNGEVIEISPSRIEPKVTTAQLAARYGLIAEAVTNASSSSSNRLTNIKRALSSIQGTRLDPGEVFSFNDTVGKRTPERGYKPAGAYIDGLVTEEVGGGICQVSTTLFNASVKSNLTIVERSAHSRPVAYVDKGKDATVSWPGPDLKFRNDSEDSVYIVAYLTDGGRVHVEMYGLVLEDGLSVKVEAKTLKTLQPGSDRVSVNDSLPIGARVVIEEARVGYKAVAYKVYYRNGSEIKREELCRSTYNASGAVIEVGPTE